MILFSNIPVMFCCCLIVIRNLAVNCGLQPGWHRAAAFDNKSSVPVKSEPLHVVQTNPVRLHSASGPLQSVKLTPEALRKRGSIYPHRKSQIM